VLGYRLRGFGFRAAMDRLFKSAISVRELKPHTDDDYADRLSRLYTVTGLVKLVQ